MHKELLKEEGRSLSAGFRGDNFEGLMAEPGDLAFCITAGLLFHGLPAGMGVCGSLDLRTDGLITDDCRCGRCDCLDSGNLCDYPLFKHQIDAPVDSLKQNRGRALQKQPGN